MRSFPHPVGYTAHDHDHHDRREKGRDVAHKTLGTFAREQKAGRASTALSKLDPKLLEEVVEGYRRGINVTVIARWLRDEHGLPDMSVPKIRYHMELHGIGWGEAAGEQGA